ncbi:hypothetical protein MOMA_00765 [Moraxella macacae 0408225]|uniref:L,D-TPase catalytic domain-containing protein n=1 Tax=Moraxella macacae 0408225 TaxID=1230338 RepID=L2F738_9GAMM|nr:L,D-transpeptidase [Moraxella macacae]ELA08899.1 hypothetical protein MOMA_00765 [Moraxella macacae 0408225]
MTIYPLIQIFIAKQQLVLHLSDHQFETFSVSTGKNGTGQQNGSGCTPLGKHQICAKFGENLPPNSVFVARQFTGEIYNTALACQFVDRDWILTRILWLDGCEPSINQGENALGNCDSRSRYIYIHGTPDSEPMGIPRSHGCVRMRNADIMTVFAKVNIGTIVEIYP